MTTKANQMKINTIKICEATKKNGDPCKFKAQPNSCFCGVHKNFIDTSKPLFTEDIEEKEKLTLNFMTGENIKINKGHVLDYILNIIKQNNPLDNYNYSIFRDGAEDKITDDTYKFNDDNYFCMPSQKFTYEVGDYIYRYAKFMSGSIIHKIYKLSRTTPNEFLKNNDGFNDATYYKIVKRSKCFITLKWKRGVVLNTYGKDNVILKSKYDELFEDLNYNYNVRKFKFEIDADGNENCGNSIPLPAKYFKGE